MGKYTLFGKQVTFDDSGERFFDYQNFAFDAIDDAYEEFLDWYNSCGNIQVVLNKFDEKAKNIINKYAINPLFGQLTELEMFDISKTAYEKRCWFFDNCSDAYNQIATKYNSIIEQQEAEEAYREYRKDSRARVSGGGFGVSGAIKGMAAAGAMNAASGVGHGIANAIGNAKSAIVASSSKKELYDNKGTPTLLGDGIESDMLDVFNEHMRWVNERKNRYYHNCFDSDKAEALFQNAKKVHEKKIELLTEAFRNQPWKSSLLEYIFLNFKEERANVKAISKRFCVDLSDVFEQVLESECKKQNTSSLQGMVNTRAHIISLMIEFGVSESRTLDELEQRLLREVINGYENADDSSKSKLFKEFEQAETQKKNKIVVIKEQKIWELAKEYGVEFTGEEIESIISKEFDSNADVTEDEALRARARIITIMNKFGVKDSPTLDKLEMFCLNKLCSGYENADERECNEIIQRINDYSALNKNKKAAVAMVQRRIERIWTAEDGEVFDNIFINTDIYDPASVAAAIETIKEKKRTNDAQKYLEALEHCNERDIKKAKQFKSATTKIYKTVAYGFLAIAILSYFALGELIISVIPLAIGIAFFVVVSGRKTMWETITLNEKIIHPKL